MFKTSYGQDNTELVNFLLRYRCLCWYVYFNNSLEIRKLFQVVGDLDSISSLAWKAANHTSHHPRKSFQAMTVLESRQSPLSCTAIALLHRKDAGFTDESEKANVMLYSYKSLNTNLKLFYHWLFLCTGKLCASYYQLEEQATISQLITLPVPILSPSFS